MGKNIKKIQKFKFYPKNDKKTFLMELKIFI